jgi:hypothetical protein
MVLAKAKRSSNVQPPRNIRMLPTTSVISQKSSRAVFMMPAGLTYFSSQIKRLSEKPLISNPTRRKSPAHQAVVNPEMQRLRGCFAGKTQCQVDMPEMKVACSPAEFVHTSAMAMQTVKRIPPNACSSVNPWNGRMSRSKWASRSAINASLISLRLSKRTTRFLIL